VVDDAIVMIENISRYIEEGEKPLAAALKGSEQIGFTIVSLTVSLIAVLIPLLFMGDIVGRLFREFAVTLAVTILVSAVVSLTLTPMISSGAPARSNIPYRVQKAQRVNRRELLIRTGTSRGPIPNQTRSQRTNRSQPMNGFIQVLLHHHFNVYKSKTYASNDLRFCLIFIYLNPHSQKEKTEILVGFYNLVLNR